MALSEATVQLPSLGSLKVTKEGDALGKLSKVDSANNLYQAKSFLSQLKLGSLRKQKRPGDVWRSESGYTSVAKQPRPLGLIPNRQLQFSNARDLSRILPPLTLYTTTARDSHVTGLNVQETGNDVSTKSNSQQSMHTKEQISAIVKHTESKVQSSGQDTDTSVHHPQSLVINHAHPPPSKILGIERPRDNYRYSYKQHNNDEPLQTMLPREPDQTDDLDYLDTLAKCNIHDYCSLPPTHTRHRAHTLPPPHTSAGVNTETHRVVKKSARPEWSHSRSNSVQFVSFTGQSQLWNRLLTDDRRDSQGYEPCERCRERGGRCARCKVLRVGGGYIILDGDNFSEDELQNRFRNRYGLGSGHRFSMKSKGSRRLRPLPPRAGGEDGGTSSHDWSGGADTDNNRQRGSGDVGRRVGQGWSGLDNGDNVFSAMKGNAGDGRLSSDLDRGSVGNEDWDKKGRGHRSDSREGGRGPSQEGSYSPDGDRQRVNKSSGRRGMGVVEDGRDGGSGRDSSRGVSRMSGSRPGSTRPASSVRRSGGPDGRHRGRLATDREVTGVGGGHGKNKSVTDRTSKNEEEGWQDKRPGQGRGCGDEVSSEYERLKFNSSRDSDEPRPMSGYHGNMMRFKRRTNDVKALHATLKELQGIDPLDYLARYCIIDQTKLPHYRHCYDNVDRDEDDEINIAELDFALKAVNFDLISDTEMNYVNSVLELAGRYKLNFQLFSLIAALSEKVVALEDMVKRLINGMDFGALEVKMKKCKELFYLLADSESNSQHEGGVVTTNSLSVELQAGGLTHEHVDFVVDRLNYEGKNLVEFLDYLTYVPLFVEIHDSISGNPLDCSRTK